MAPRLRLLISSGSKRKEPRYVCLSEPTASHSHRMWDGVPSSAPHLLHKGLLVSLIKWGCLLRVSFTVRRPITAPYCVLLKDKSLFFLVGLGPEVSFRASLCLLLRSRHITRCWLSTQLYIFLFIFCLRPKRTAEVLQNSERNRLLRACRRFRFRVPQHVQ